MHPTTLPPLLLLLLAPLLTASSPLTPRAPDDPHFTYANLTLTFHGGPARYTLPLAADGNTYALANPLAVSEITVEPASFDLYASCSFSFASPAQVARKADGSGVQVGPPRPVVGVSCQPTGDRGMCLPVYATCEWCGGMNGLGGCRVLNCCSGYCAATKCRKTS